MPYTDEYVRSARDTLGALWPLLRPGLWHSTPLTRYNSIFEGGEIRPACTGFAASVNAVSLFDFENAGEDEALGFYKQWRHHLWHEEVPLRVWIRLNRDLLPGHLMLARKAGKRALTAGGLWYPRVEACHIGPVPAKAFAGLLAVSTTCPYQFERVAIGESGLLRLRELDEEWRRPPDENDEQIRILRAARARG